MSLAIDDLLPPPPQPLDFVQKRQNGIAIHGDEILGVLPSLDALDTVPCAVRPVRHPQGIRTAVSSQANHLIRPRRRRFSDTTQLCQPLRRQLIHALQPPLALRHAVASSPRLRHITRLSIPRTLSQCKTACLCTPHISASARMLPPAFRWRSASESKLSPHAISASTILGGR